MDLFYLLNPQDPTLERIDALKNPWNFGKCYAFPSVHQIPSSKQIPAGTYINFDCTLLAEEGLVFTATLPFRRQALVSSAQRRSDPSGAFVPPQASSFQLDGLASEADILKSKGISEA